MTYINTQLADLSACQNDPIYFIEKFCIIETATTLQTLILSPAQKEVINTIQNNQYVSVMAARQFGKSLIGSAYILWIALFRPNNTLGIMGTNFRATDAMISTILDLYKNVPIYMKPQLVSKNKSEICFANNSHIRTLTSNVNSVRGIAFSFLFLDEFAFNTDANRQDEFMRALLPCLSASGGKCVITSTPNRKDDLFWHTHHHDPVFSSLTYTWEDIPNKDEKWKDDQIKNLGYKNFYREYECKIDTLNDLYAEIERLKQLL